MLELMSPSRPTLQLKNNPRPYPRLNLLPLPLQTTLPLVGAAMGVWTLPRFRVSLRSWDSVRESTRLELETVMAP